MKTILFVCTGNTCRSSMAEALFKNMLTERNRDDWEVLSAGVSAFDGNGAHENAILTLEEEGIATIKEHQAQRLNQNLIEQADLILTMTQQHKALIFNQYPDAETKTYTLKEYALFDGRKQVSREKLDISDPFGQVLKEYKRSANEIKKCLKQLLKKLD